MKGLLGLDNKTIQKSVTCLEIILADTFVLYTKTLNFHWNIVGPSFRGLHALFQKQYEDLALSVDKIAERIRSLGVTAPGTLAGFLKITTLKEQEEHLNDAEMLQSLLNDHETLVTHIRRDLKKLSESDIGTKNLLEDLLSNHEKVAWMLRSHLL